MMGLKSIFLLLIVALLSSCQTTSIEDHGFTKTAHDGVASSTKVSPEAEKPPIRPMTPVGQSPENANDGSSPQKPEPTPATDSGPSPKDANPEKPSGEKSAKQAPSPKENDVSPSTNGESKSKPAPKGRPEEAGPKSVVPPMIFGGKPKEPKKPPPTKDGLATGTGFFISANGYLLTNEHVIADARELKVFVGDTAYEARVVSFNKEDDIAVLKIDLETKPLFLKTSEPLAGIEVSVLGYPNIGLQGNEIKSTFGHVNAASGIQGDKRYFQFSAEIQPGNSGSPVIDEDGFVIGVATSTLNQEVAVAQTGALAQGVNYALKASYADQLIKNSKLEISSQTKTTNDTSRVELIQQIKESVVLIVAAIGKEAKIPKTKPKGPNKPPVAPPTGGGKEAPMQPTPQPSSSPNSASPKEPKPPSNSAGSPSGGTSSGDISNEETSEEQQPSNNRYHYIHFDRK